MCIFLQGSRTSQSYTELKMAAVTLIRKKSTGDSFHRHRFDNPPSIQTYLSATTSNSIKHNSCSSLAKLSAFEKSFSLLGRIWINRSRRSQCFPRGKSPSLTTNNKIRYLLCMNNGENNLGRELLGRLND